MVPGHVLTLPSGGDGCPLFLTGFLTVSLSGFLMVFLIVLSHP